MPRPEVVVGLAVGLLLLGLISGIVAYQARRRGYRFLPWLVAGVLGNPIFFLVLLAVLPDYARKARRRRELADLEAKLAARLKVLPPAPPSAGPHPAPVTPDRSLGDQPTVLPAQRSVGDEETHL
jgi:hypothetical protein